MSLKKKISIKEGVNAMAKQSSGSNKGRRAGSPIPRLSKTLASNSSDRRRGADGKSAASSRMVAALKKMASNAALAGAALNKTITTYNPPVPGIYLYIDNIAPTPLIENRLARVYFTIGHVTSHQIR